MHPAVEIAYVRAKRRRKAHLLGPADFKQNLHGKEGVSGSSPEEGLKFLQIGTFCCLVRRDLGEQYGGGHVHPHLQELSSQRPVGRAAREL
jgi:hypothetical protein